MTVDHVPRTVETATSPEADSGVNSSTNGDAETHRYASYGVGYVYDARMMLHSCSSGHQEDPSRISRIFELLKTSGCIAQMIPLPSREVRREEALLVHSEALWEKVMFTGSMF